MNQVTPKDVYELDKLNENEKQIYKKVNQTIKKYDEEINHFRFNTAIAAMMELLNEMKKIRIVFKRNSMLHIKKICCVIGSNCSASFRGML